MNRKKMILLNSSAVMLTTIINILFGIIEVSLFISKYGSEVNGLKQTGTQLLSYLSLIEAGIGASYVYSLYKPIAKNDEKKISELYYGFQKSIRIVVCKMLIVAILISFIYPLFLQNNDMTYLFMTSVFVLLSIKSIVPYLIAYVPKYMIIAKEQRYKTEIINGVTNALIYVVEIFIIIYTNFTIQILLIICIAISLLSGSIYYLIMKKIYSIKKIDHCNIDLTPNNMSKDVLVHNISGLVFNSTDNIIISVFSNLTNVTIYSNYNLIINQVTSVFQSIYDGVTASLGIKIINKDNNSYTVFRELLSFTFILAALISSTFIVMINEFVKIWVGQKFVVSYHYVYLWGIILYCGILLPCIISARNACGLYKESKIFTVIQAIVNLFLTLVLTPYMGICGALIGTAVARVFISLPFNYKLVYDKVFVNEKIQWHEMILGLGYFIILSYIEILVCRVIPFSFISNSMIKFLLRTFIVSIIGFISTILFYYCTDMTFKNKVRNIIIKYK